MLARLQAVSSRNIYSEQGFEPLIRPELGRVCHSLMVVSNWTPGSAQRQADWATLAHRSRALTVLATWSGLVRQRSSQLPSAVTAAINVSVTRTELLEFWPE